MLDKQKNKSEEKIPILSEAVKHAISPYCTESIFEANFQQYSAFRGRLPGNHNDFHWQLAGQINHQPCSYKAGRVIKCTELDSAVSSF